MNGNVEEERNISKKIDGSTFDFYPCIHLFAHPRPRKNENLEERARPSSGSNWKREKGKWENTARVRRVCRGTLFSTPHIFYGFKKEKRKKKIARETNDCCDWTNQGFFQEGGGGGGEGTREGRGIIETKNINRVGVLRGRNGQKRQPSSPGWGVVRFSQRGIAIANTRSKLDIYTSCTRAYVRGELRFWLTTLSFIVYRHL